MLDNSYDIPGVRFGIMVADQLNFYGKKMMENPSIDYKSNILELLREKKDTRIIDFSHFSGLTLEEVKELINSNVLIFCSFSSIEDKENIFPAKKGNKIYSMTVFPISDKNKDEIVDKEILWYLKQDYANGDEKTCRNAKCFVNRYIDSDESAVTLLLK